MNRKLVVGGSLGAVILLVLAMFPTVVGTQKKTSVSNSISSEFLNEVSLNEVGKLPPPRYLSILWDILISLFLWFFINIWANIVS